MLTEILQNFSIPKEKNVIFINPELSKWSSLLAQNKLTTKNIPNRLNSRRELLTIARNYTLRIIDSCPNNISENIITTGHQATWHHCGIWSKNLTTCKFAKTVDGNSLHLVLDHDICDTAMVLPKQNTDGSWYSEKIEIELSKNSVPLEFRRLPQESSIKTFVDSVINARAGQFCSDIWSEYMALKKNKISYFNNIADLITYFQSVLNTALGLNIIYLPVSKLSESDAFINFIVSVMLDSASFAAAYNDAVTRQINELNINQRDSVQHLKLDNTTGLAELPFWLLLPNGKRTSLYVVSQKNGKIGIGTASTVLGNLDSTSRSGKAEQLKNMLRHINYRLRPKAVSLTLFVRLFLADWFVHGIGGSLYESVTNHMIENYYRIGPLRFGVATLTMTLPLSNNVTFPEKNISQLKHELHNIKHNPEKYIDESILEEEPVASLLQAKREEIARAKDRSLPGNERKAAWNLLFRINESLSEFAREDTKALETRIRELEKNAVSQEVGNDRKYFFGLFPEKKLRKLGESLTFTGQNYKSM
jgi:hypothetical protein